MKEVYRTLVQHSQSEDLALVSIFFNRENDNIEIEKYMVNYIDENEIILGSHFTKVYDDIDDELLAFCFFLLEEAELI